MFINLSMLLTADLPTQMLDACYKQSRYSGAVRRPKWGVIHSVPTEKSPSPSPFTVALLRFLPHYK